MRILFATDGSEAAEEARQFLAALPLPEGSTLHVLSVVDTRWWSFGALNEPSGPWQLVEQLRQSERDYAGTTVRQAAEALARDRVEVVTSVREGSPASEILLAAEECSVGLIVVGSRGLSGAARFLLGSAARNVARYSARPVLVATAPRHGLREVLLGVDGSPHASHATDFLCRLPLPAESHVTIAHVIRPHKPYPGLHSPDPALLKGVIEAVHRQDVQAARRIVEEARLALEMHDRIAGTRILDGDPATCLLDLAAEREADLIVAGARGHSLIQGLFVGSVADRVQRHAHCSVLLVH